ncbi:hypothetical protein KSP40_PGU016737 [Platanthera guangdongensis]|uniref:Uncharacterized protein n=1 Tax=Platanthera guangdongensis TaxID=2320717 RepID=A0ABR2LR88_9ASPA
MPSSEDPSSAPSVACRLHSTNASSSAPKGSRSESRGTPGWQDSATSRLLTPSLGWPRQRRWRRSWRA